MAAAESLGLIASEEADKRKEEIRSRLKLLRSGQFGAKRAEAKEKIEEAYAQWKKGVENP